MARGIYLITCTGNKRRYVGSSNNIPYRWRKHKEKLASGKHWNQFLQRSWNKYGGETFEFAVLEEAEDVTQLHIREQYWIDTLHPEFNLSPYANRPTTEGLTYSEETRQRMSMGIRKSWDALSEEERKERGAKSRHPISEEHKARLREVNGRINEQRREARLRQRAEWETGKAEREQERREKLRLANTGKQRSEKTRTKLREVALQQQADPEYKAKHQKAVSEAMQRPEVKERHRKGIATRPPMSEEHRANIGKAHRGMKRPPETGEKIATSKRGKKRSPETIEKLKAAWVRRKARAAEKEDYERG